MKKNSSFCAWLMFLFILALLGFLLFPLAHAMFTDASIEVNDVTIVLPRNHVYDIMYDSNNKMIKADFLCCDGRYSFDFVKMDLSVNGEKPMPLVKHTTYKIESDGSVNAITRFWSKKR